MNDRASKPEAWFEKADRDRLAVSNIIAGESIPWDIVCFHARGG